MARIIRSTNHLELEMELVRKNHRLWFIILIASIVLLIPTVGLIFPLVIASSIKFNKYKSELDTWKAGLEGEKWTQEVFRRLPDCYTVICDLNIEFEGKSSQIDHVVLGPSGIFVVETKHLNGEIAGNPEDHDLIQYKTGRRGHEYSKSFYNPIKQVGTHVYRLSSLLKQNGVNNWVQGMVYFSNPQADVMVDSDSIPVFSTKDGGAGEMTKYILGFKENPVSQASQEKATRLLTRYIICSECSI